ncbi:MAG: hypothetical protein WBG37_21680 [Desulfobacterales bacterium]|jgi:hypothetical protein
MRKVFVILLCLMVFTPQAMVCAAADGVAKVQLSADEISGLQQLDEGQMDSIRASGNVPWIVLIVMGAIAVYFAYEGGF